MRFIKLNNETEMPIIGLGTWKSEPSEAYAAVRWALKLGYTHFDCAAIYNNEEAVGQAFADAMAEDGLKREDIFVTSKLWNNAHRAEDVAPALQEMLTRLKLEYLDLFLMHWPVAQKKEALMPLTADDMLPLSEAPIADTWQAMEELYKEGKAKAIGVSNFGEKSLNRTGDDFGNQSDGQPGGEPSLSAAGGTAVLLPEKYDCADGLFSAGIGQQRYAGGSGY